MTDMPCPKHGAYPIRVVASPCPGEKDVELKGCPDCNLERIEAERRREAERLRLLKIDRSNIPQRFRDLSLESFPRAYLDQAETVDRCKRWVQHFKAVATDGPRGSWLVMTGSVGAGKTGIACSVLQKIIEMGYKGLYHTVPTIRSWCWDSTRRGSYPSEAMTELVRTDLLIIDELGTTTSGDAENALLNELLDKRHAQLRPTILISNLNREQLAIQLGDRIYDRVQQCAAWLTFDWPSLRIPTTCSSTVVTNTDER